jgi:hypothetical protein
LCVIEISTSIRFEINLKVTFPAAFPQLRSIAPVNAAMEFTTERLTSFR